MTLDELLRTAKVRMLDDENIAYAFEACNQTNIGTIKGLSRVLKAEGFREAEATVNKEDVEAVKKMRMREAKIIKMIINAAVEEVEELGFEKGANEFIKDRESLQRYKSMSTEDIYRQLEKADEGNASDCDKFVLSLKGENGRLSKEELRMQEAVVAKAVVDKSVKEIKRLGFAKASKVATTFIRDEQMLQRYENMSTEDIYREMTKADDAVEKGMEIFESDCDKFIGHIKENITGGFKEEGVGRVAYIPYNTPQKSDPSVNDQYIRFYINLVPDIYNAVRVDFVQRFMLKCIEKNLPFMMKAIGADAGIGSGRADNCIFYALPQDFSAVCDILKEIEYEAPELIESFGTPLTTGMVSEDLKFAAVTHDGDFQQFLRDEDVVREVLKNKNENELVCKAFDILMAKRALEILRVGSEEEKQKLVYSRFGRENAEKYLNGIAQGEIIPTAEDHRQFVNFGKRLEAVEIERRSMTDEEYTKQMDIDMAKDLLLELKSGNRFNKKAAETKAVFGEGAEEILEEYVNLGVKGIDYNNPKHQAIHEKLVQQARFEDTIRRNVGFVLSNTFNNHMDTVLIYAYDQTVAIEALRILRSGQNKELAEKIQKVFGNNALKELNDYVTGDKICYEMKTGDKSLHAKLVEIAGYEGFTSTEEMLPKFKHNIIKINATLIIDNPPEKHALTLGREAENPTIKQAIEGEKGEEGAFALRSTSGYSDPKIGMEMPLACNGMMYKQMLAERAECIETIQRVTAQSTDGMYEYINTKIKQQNPKQSYPMPSSKDELIKKYIKTVGIDKMLDYINMIYNLQKDAVAKGSVQIGDSTYTAEELEILVVSAELVKGYIDEICNESEQNKGQTKTQPAKVDDPIERF